MIRAAVSAPRERAEELRARFLELAPEGFEERERPDGIELAAYAEAAARVLAAFPEARASEVGDGWEERWRDFHHAVRLGPLWVGPPWQEPAAGTVPVVIDPGRAFGTGAHATTRLCLELLLDEPRGGLLDLGCGSGVIAIAAAALGFTPVEGLDCDPVAVAAARANAEANGAAARFRAADVLGEELPAAELAVANIALEVVNGLGACLTAPRLIASGYRARDRPEVAGYRARARRELDGWAADLLVRG